MTQENWNLIAKHLAKETNEAEAIKINILIETNDEFRAAYSDSSKLWFGIKKTPTVFDKKRIEYLREHRIKQANKQEQRLKIQRFYKYAAIFIGFLIGISFMYYDINNTKNYDITNTKNGTLLLPDGSEIALNEKAIISYNNSLIMGFSREVRILTGSAFFNITKKNGKRFIVKTDNYNIEVLGTKFNVDNSIKETCVVLDEGKIILNNYCKDNIAQIELHPGEKIVFGTDFNKPQLEKVNTEVSKYWMKSKLYFDKYSLSDLKIIFKEYYGKQLIINNDKVVINKIGGSAPTDDINLIIKGLSIVLKQDLINRNDSIIIN